MSNTVPEIGTESFLSQKVKISSFFLFVFFSLLLFLMPFNQTDAATSGDYEYEVINGDEAKITAYQGNDTDITIPEELDGHVVTEIGDNAFNDKNLSSVILPEHLKHIGIRAFISNNLTSIALPDTLETIETGAFSSNNLIEVDIPESVTSIGDTDSISSYGLKKVIFRNSNTTIGSNAFQNQTGNDNVVVIGYSGSTAEIYANDKGYTFNFFIDIPDDNLRKVINHELSENETYQPLNSDLEMLTIIDAEHSSIQSLEGLQYATNLKGAYFSSNDIQDISPLEDLTDLSFLEFRFNAISDISALENLANIKVLNLYSNNISDISILQKLTNLVNLDISNNPVSDLSPLKDLTQLDSLNVFENDLTDISPLENLTNLTFLDIGINNISDITSLKNLVNLKTLYIDSNVISDISVLENLVNLEGLVMIDNNINDISALENIIPNLTYKELGNQELLLPEVSIAKSLSTLKINNPIIDSDGTFYDDITVEGDGTYNNSMIQWEKLDESISERFFTFGDLTDPYYESFSGTVKQPFKWIDTEVIIPLDIETEIFAGQNGIVEDMDTQITFPDDLPMGTTVTVTDASGEDFATNAKGIERAGDILNFTFNYTNDERSSNDFILTMGFGNGVGTDVDIYYYNETDKKWEAQKGNVDGPANKITTNADHFSSYGVFALKEESEEPPVKKKGNPSKTDEQDTGDDEVVTVTISDDGGENEILTDGEDTLPKTATNTFNLIVIGLLLLLLGAISLIVVRKKTSQ